MRVVATALPLELIAPLPQWRTSSVDGSAPTLHVGSDFAPIARRCNVSAILTRLTEAFAGRYVIERELGRGGMATVYLAQDLKHRRPVALKLLHVDIMSVGGVERFLREIELTAKLQHPHILPLLDSGEVPLADAPGRPSQGPSLLYYIMPYVEGITLQARMSSGPLPVPDAVRILRDVVDALAAAHNFGVVHRDIKPQNIMLSGRHAMVMDFGVAKALRAAMPDDQITATGMVVGTPAYMAPEQLIADPRVDHRADLYSVGVVAYEMLAGRRPSGGEPLRMHRQDLPEELERVVMKCLATKAGDRWQSAEELLERLEALVMTGDRGAAAGQKVRRSRALTFGVPAVIVAGSIGAALLARGDRDASGRPAPAERQVTFSGKVTHAALSPDGRMLAYTSKEGRQSKLVVQDLTGGRAVQTDSFLQTGELDWSPDGANLALSALLHDSTFGLFVIPRLGGSRRWVGEAFLTRWSPDGKRLAAWFHPWKSIQVIEVATLDTTDLRIPGSFEWLSNVAWSPAGDRLAYQTASPGRYVTGLMGIDGSGARELTVDSTPLNGLAWAPEADALYYRRGDVIRKIRLSPGGAEKSLPILRGGGDPEWWQTRSLSVSADGTRLAYLKSTRYSNLWLTTREGNASRGRWTTKRLTTGTAERRVPAISPDGRWIAYVELGAGRSDVFVLPLDGGQPRQVTDLGTVLAMEHSVAWSPDGRSVAFGAPLAGDARVWIAPVRGGQARAFESSRLSETGSVAWYPVRDIIYHRSGNRNLHLLDTVSGKEHPLLEDDSLGWLGDPEPSPDGGRVAVSWSRTARTSGVWVIPMQGGPPLRLGAGSLLHPIGWQEDGQGIYAIEENEIESRESLYIHVLLPTGGDQAIVVPLDCGLGVDITPGGRQLVCAVEESVSDVWLVENFDPDR